jgi:tight adherence protein B
MTGALLSTALAALLWPDRRTVRRARMASVVDRRPPYGDRSPHGVDLPLPAAAAAAAGGLGAIGSTPLVAGLAAAVAYLLARLWTAGRAERRSEEEVRGLTEGLAVLAAELRSGRSLAAATHTAAGTCPDAESGRALAAAVRAPGGVGPGHRDPGVRSALERVAAGASLSARTGCSLAAVLTAVEDDLRARSRHRLELRASTAGPRAGAAVLAGLPVLGLVMGSGVGADPWRVLTTTSAGQVLLVAGAVLEAAGVCWSRWLIGRAVR